MDNDRLQQCCVLPTTSLKEVISCFEASGDRVVLVLDNNERLCGVITDGDLRRAFMNSYALETQASEVMNTTPITLPVGSSQSKILQVMNDASILHVPILGDNGRLDSLASITDFNQRKAWPNPVLIMAGGFGRRLMPLTKDTPKPMLEVGGRPILEIIISHLEKEGLRDIFISTHHKAEVITDHFGDGGKFGVSIRYLNEHTPLGTAGGISLMPEISHPLLVINGDVISDIDFSALVDFHNSAETDCTTVFSWHEVTVPFGVMATAGTQVESVTEKPTYQFKVNAGIYILGESVVNAFSEPTHMDMPDIVSDLLLQKKSVSAFPLHETWVDIGSHEQFAHVLKNADKA